MLSEKQKDRAATAVIRVGGILVILVVAAIVANIGLEALPLFRGASQGPLEAEPAPAAAVLAGSDARREIVWVLTRSGRIEFPTEPGREPLELLEGASVVAADLEIHGLLSVIDSSGRVTVGSLRFRDDWQGDRRTTVVRWRPAAEPLELGSQVPWTGVTANASGDGSVTAVAWGRDGGLVIAGWNGDGEVWEVAPPVLVGGVGTARAAIAEELATAAVVGVDGELRVISLPDASELDLDGVTGEAAGARYLIGGGTLVAATRDGEIAVLLEVPRVKVTNAGASELRFGELSLRAGASVVLVDDQASQALAAWPDVGVETAPPVWTVVRTAPAMAAEPVTITAGHRRRDFLVGGGDGSVSLYYSTSGRRLQG